jgi:NADP-dependent 3-hydroxy acid dehydrogenase YdfG
MSKKLVVITGASSGIGAALARLFKEKGYPLLLMAQREERLKEFKSDAVLCKKVDVSDLQALKKSIDEAEKKFGPTDCLINNAAVLYLALFHEQDPQEWRRTFDVNIAGVANGMHLVLPGMVQRKEGTVFNICSVAGHGAYPTQAAYCASKFAIWALTTSVRQEVSPHGVRVMMVSPGAVETEVGKQTSSKQMKASFDEMRKKMNPLDPSSIAKAILYAYEQPPQFCMREMIIAPTSQAD